jgi:hypothetical protein
MKRQAIGEHAFLIAALDKGEWSASRAGRFTSGERASGTHWTGGWEGTRAGMDTVAKGKVRAPVGNRNEQRNAQRGRTQTETITFVPTYSL